MGKTFYLKCDRGDILQFGNTTLNVSHYFVSHESNRSILITYNLINRTLFTITNYYPFGLWRVKYITIQDVLFVRIVAWTRWISEHQSTISTTTITRSNPSPDVRLWWRWQERGNIFTQCPLSLTPRGAFLSPLYSVTRLSESNRRFVMQVNEDRWTVVKVSLLCRWALWIVEWSCGC